MSRRPVKSGWHPPLDPHDAALWEDVKKTVRRLPKAARKKEKLAVSTSRLEKPAPAPVRLEKKSIVKKAVTNAAPAVIDRMTMRKIKKGRVKIDDTLDLHGMRQEAAHRALEGFIHAAQKRGCKTVLIITGKGDRFAKSEGILRKEVPRWLKETDLRHKISGISKAAASHGGEGAFYLRLRKL